MRERHCHANLALVPHGFCPAGMTQTNDPSREFDRHP